MQHLRQHGLTAAQLRGTFVYNEGSKELEERAAKARRQAARMAAAEEEALRCSVLPDDLDPELNPVASIWAGLTAEAAAAEAASAAHAAVGAAPAASGNHEEWPWATLILSGAKTREVRTQELGGGALSFIEPGKKAWLVETPPKKGGTLPGSPLACPRLTWTSWAARLRRQ